MLTTWPLLKFRILTFPCSELVGGPLGAGSVLDCLHIFQQRGFHSSSSWAQSVHREEAAALVGPLHPVTWRLSLICSSAFTAAFIFRPPCCFLRGLQRVPSKRALSPPGPEWESRCQPVTTKKKVTPSSAQSEWGGGDAPSVLAVALTLGSGPGCAWESGEVSFPCSRESYSARSASARRVPGYMLGTGEATRVQPCPRQDRRAAEAHSKVRRIKNWQGCHPLQFAKLLRFHALGGPPPPSPVGLISCRGADRTP